MARVLAVVPDLMLSSRVVETLSAAGHEVEVSPSLPELERRRCARLRPRRDRPGAVAGLGLPSLGFYSHVEVETRRGGRGRRRRRGRAALADGARAAALVEGLLAWPRRTPSRRSGTPALDVERSLRAARARGPRPPIRAAPRGSNGAGWRSGSRALQLRGLVGAVEAVDGVDQVVQGPGRGGRRRRRSRGGRGDHVRDQVRVVRRASCARWRGPARGRAGRRIRSTLKIRIGTPLRRSSTPSAFQKPVAASTLPAASEETALKPIVTRSTPAGSPPSALTSESTTASSEGRPVTPTVWPSRSRGRRTGPSPRAITEASGRCTIGITPTTSRPCSRAIPRSWMSRIAKSVRPAASSFGASVDSPGSRTVRSTPASR